MEFSLGLCPTGAFSVCRVEDPPVALGLRLHLPFGGLAFAFGVGDQPSVL
jgi:hypothetical protein